MDIFCAAQSQTIQAEATQDYLRGISQLAAAMDANGPFFSGLLYGWILIIYERFPIMLENVHQHSHHSNSSL